MATTATARIDPGGPRFAAEDRPALRLLGAEAARELAGRLHSGREIARRQEKRRRDAFATGVAPFDQLIGGGLPRGRLVELVGRPGSGRLSVALGALAAATAAGEAAALVDLGDGLDPRGFAARGGEASRLLWVRPRTTKQALVAAEALLAGGFPLLVVDLGLPPVPGGRGLEAGWVRLARAAQAGGASLLVSSPYRASGTAAAVVVEARPRRALLAPSIAARGHAAPPLFAGCGSRFRLEKSRGRTGGEESVADLLFAAAALPANGHDLSPGTRSAPSPVSPSGTAERVPADPVAGPAPDAAPFPLPDRVDGPATGYWSAQGTPSPAVLALHSFDVPPVRLSRSSLRVAGSDAP